MLLSRQQRLNKDMSAETLFINNMNILSAKIPFFFLLHYECMHIWILNEY